MKTAYFAILILTLSFLCQINRAHAADTNYAQLEIQLWTDTDDKDSEESVSVEIRVGDKVIGRGGPLGGGEVWGDQEDKNNGQPHLCAVNLKEVVNQANVASTEVYIIKSQAGGNGGKGWHFRLTVFGIDEGGVRHELIPQTGTIKLGNGKSAVHHQAL